MTGEEAKIHALIDEMIRERVIFGASYAFIKKGERKLFYKGVEGAMPPFDGLELMPGLYYDLASLTKVVGTAVRILQLSEEGRLSTETPVRKILERFRYPDITVGDLLLHVSGLPAEVIHKERLTRETILEAVYGTLAERGRGQGFLYSDVGFILLGLVIREVEGVSLEESFREHIFKPLNMRHTSYEVGGEKRYCIPTECTARRGCIQGVVHDSKACLLGQSGSAGLFSTLEDLTIFVSHYLSHSPELFGETTFRLVRETEQFGRTYGWSKEYGRDTLYHTGFTGTSIWMNTEERRGFVLLTNRIHPSRDNERFLLKRTEIHRLLSR